MLRQIGQGQIIPHGDSRPELLSAQGHAEAFERETVQKCTGPILGLDCFSFSRHLLTRHARKTGPLGCARDLPWPTPRLLSPPSRCLASSQRQGRPASKALGDRGGVQSNRIPALFEGQMRYLCEFPFSFRCYCCPWAYWKHSHLPC